LEWAQQQIDSYGRNDPWVLVNVFGQFPPASINSLLGPDEVAAAMKRKLVPDAYADAQKRMSVDVARFGDDETVIFCRQGLQVQPAVVMRNARGNEVAARMMAIKAEWGSELEFVDSTGGYGGSVVDSLIQAGQSPIPVDYSSSPGDGRFLNKRAEIWWLMAEWVKRGGALPEDSALAAELTAVTYLFNNGKFQLVSKQQVKDVLGRSPDRGDSLAGSFALPEMPGRSGIEMVLGRKGREQFTEHEYDPLEMAGKLEGL
jgi:hypothetical protein